MKKKETYVSPCIDVVRYRVYGAVLSTSTFTGSTTPIEDDRDENDFSGSTIDLGYE